MITVTIKHQETYSRGELLLRSFFAPIYMVLPHMLAMIIFAIGGGFLNFIAFWAILFTGKYPKGMFEYQVKLMRWSLRLNARMQNLSDGYPSFGMNGTDDKTHLDITYPETSSRGLLLARAFFGMIYVYIPHGFCLLFRSIASAFVRLAAWWVVLFTGNYPEGMHEFNVGTIRWGIKVAAYMGNMTDKYPAFTGRP